MKKDGILIFLNDVILSQFVKLFIKGIVRMRIFFFKLLNLFARPNLFKSFNKPILLFSTIKNFILVILWYGFCLDYSQTSVYESGCIFVSLTIPLSLLTFVEPEYIS